tara:strand:+ start:242 stop:487 length:246 start_codon:yes stop_codon:yes gene_type:complete
MHKSISIKVKKDSEKSIRTTIDVSYGDAIAEYKVREIGNLMTSLNPDAIVEVSFLVHNSISNTWMEMFSYYADENKLVKFT